MERDGGPGGLWWSSQFTELGLCVLSDAPGTRPDPHTASLWDCENILAVRLALCAADVERRVEIHPPSYLSPGSQTRGSPALAM